MDSYFTDQQTLTLLKIVHTKDMQDKFNSNKKRHRKVWEEISEILEQQGIKKSAAKCQNRYENTKRSYNAIKRNHFGTDKPQNYAYWDFLESVLGEKRDVEELITDTDDVNTQENFKKYSPSTPIFTDRETDELLLLMGEPATRQIFIKHRKKHRIAWNYILKCLKKKGIHKTVDKVKNRFENLKRKYMHYKKNLSSTDDPPDWRYWNVFEEYMASRPNPTETDFMADDDQSTTTATGDDCEEMNETGLEETRNRIEEHPVGDDPTVSKTEEILRATTDNPIDDRFDGKLCQICLQSEQPATCEALVSLFSPLNENIRINEALAICVGLEIFREQDSSIRNGICLDCLKQLQVSYSFRKLCWTSPYELRKNRNCCHLGDQTNCRVASSDSALLDRHKEIETSESPSTQSQFELSAATECHSSPETFETIYKFVDTNPIPPSNGATEHAEEIVLKKRTKRTSDHIEKLKNFKCSICMKKFPNIEYIKKHLVKIHSLASGSQNFKNYLELSNCDSDDELDENVKCYICGKSYVKREYLKRHLKLIHNITDADYNVYQRIDEENRTKKPLLCHNCGESFLLKHVFKKHIEHHERGSLLSCDYCDIKLVDKPALQRHMILHTGQRNHKCIFCAKGFFTRISQKRHERNVHTKEKSHICQYCDKKFVMWKFLERHLNTHTAEVVYQCDQCDKKYLNKNHLRVHKFRHAKEPPFKCSICSKAYFDRSTLKKHNYVHIGNPYQCTSCERTFDRRDKMYNHMQKVHGVAIINQENVDQSVS